MELPLIAAGVLVLAALSGMLGLGVAFVAVPFLSIFLDDLGAQVQPLTLLLNGVTALFAAVGFSREGYTDWRQGGALAIATKRAAGLNACAAAPASLAAFHLPRAHGGPRADSDAGPRRRGIGRRVPRRASRQPPARGSNAALDLRERRRGTDLPPDRTAHRPVSYPSPGSGMMAAG